MTDGRTPQIIRPPAFWIGALKHSFFSREAIYHGIFIVLESALVEREPAPTVGVAPIRARLTQPALFGKVLR